MRLINLALGVIVFPWLCGGATEGTEPVAPGPRVIHAVLPDFPTIAVTAGVIGYVVIDVEIDSEGAVKNTRLLRTPPLIDAGPMSAARMWRFEPSPEPGLRTARLTFVFDQVNSPKADSELYSRFTPPHRVDIFAKCKRRCEELDKQREGAFFGLGK